MSPIYVDISPLLLPKLTGIGRFACRLVQSLNRLAPLRLTTYFELQTLRVHELNCALMRGSQIELERDEEQESDADLSEWVAKICGRPQQPFEEREAARHAGVYTWTRPESRQFGHEVGVFYDFTPFIVPWTHTAVTRDAFHRIVVAAAMCDKMLAISQRTKSDAAWLSSVPSEKIGVAHPGPSQCLDSHVYRLPTERKSNVALIVGTREPRKNGDFLIDWFLHTSVLPDDFELWWVGPEGWLWDGPRTLADHPQFERVKFLGTVSDADLCRLYREATFTVYPSLYEGFGFPVLDSLLHDAPVLASCNSSLIELENAGVFYFDPCDTATLDDAYRQMIAARPIAIDHDALRRRFCWDSLSRTVFSLAGHSVANR